MALDIQPPVSELDIQAPVQTEEPLPLGDPVLRRIAEASGRMTAEGAKPEPGLGAQIYRDIMDPLVHMGPELVGLNPASQVALKAGQDLPGALGTIAGAALGTAQGVGDIASSLTSPLGIATLPAGYLSKPVQGGLALAFGADMARQVPAQAAQLGTLSVEGTSSDITRAGVGLAGSSVLGPSLIVGGGSRLLRSRAEAAKTGAKPPEPEPISTQEAIPFETGIGLEQFMARDPSGMSLARPVEPAPVSGQIKATPDMLEILPEFVSQQRTGQVAPPVAPPRATFEPEPAAIIEPTRKVRAMGVEQSAPMVPEGAVTLKSPASRFLVDERGVALRADPIMPRKAEIAKIKAAAVKPENAVELSARISEQEGITIFVDERGRAVIGPEKDIPPSRKIPLTQQEKIDLQREADRQVQEALMLADQIVFKQPKVGPKVVDKSLPGREAISPEESQQIATQFQQRVPSEQSRGLTEFDRPADPQIGLPVPEPVQPAPFTIGEYLANMESWADGVVAQARSRTFTGLDPQLLAAYAIKGAAYITRGVVNLGEWSAAMIKELGPNIRPYIKEIRRQSELLRSKEFKSASDPQKTAPAEYLGEQPGFGSRPGFSLYNLTEDIPGHPKGSTVSGPILEAAGYALPERKNAIQEPKTETPVLRLQEPEVPQEGQMPVPVSDSGVLPAQPQKQKGEVVLGVASGAEAFEGAKQSATGLWDRVKNHWKTNRERIGQEGMEVTLRTDTAFPDFQSREVNKANLTKAFGAERLPFVGKLFGPRGSTGDPKRLGVIAWAGERGNGGAIASAFGEQIRGQVDSRFEVGPNGEILNITPNRPGLSLQISDVFENLQRDPNAYKLTPEQRSVFEFTKQVETELRRLEDKYDLFQDQTGEYVPGRPSRRSEYFPRIVIERPATDASRLGGGRSPGSKQFFQKERLFDSEREGVSKGYKYEPSIEKRMVTRVENLYRAIADKRLAQDPAFQGITKADLEAQMRESYAPELAAGEMTEKRFQQILDSRTEKGRVRSSAFSGLVYDPETANFLNKAFPRTDRQFRQVFIQGNNALKAVRLSLDLGAALLQGQLTLFNSPASWAKASWNSLRALTSKDVFPEYVRRNIEDVRELAQLGSSVGRLQEMMAGLGEGELVTRIPGAGKAFEAFGRSFQTFLDTAKIELWKAQKDSVPRSEWQDLAQQLESELSIGRMESVGLSERQVFLERALLLAPSYYRGAVNMIASLGRKDATGARARKVMGSYLAGGIAAYYGLGMAGGMDVKELTERLNPARPDFLMWKFKTKDGRTVNFGLGGIYRSLLKLSANILKTSVEHPENWKSLSSDKNPVSRWLRGHSAPLVGLSWDGFSGRDYMGGETDVGTLGQSMLPMAAQTSLRAKGEPKATARENIMTFFGMSSYPLSVASEKREARDEISQSKFQKEYGELSPGQLVQVNREVEKKFPIKTPPTEGQLAGARKAFVERQKRVAGQMTAKEELERLGVNVSGYEPSVNLASTTVPLSRDDAEEFEKFVVEEYNRSITPQVIKRLETLAPYQRQDFLNDRLTKARGRARTRIKKVIGAR